LNYRFFSRPIYPVNAGVGAAGCRSHLTSRWRGSGRTWKSITEPDFSAQKLAAAAGLSERYVNELLYEAGASFTMRLLKLWLRKAADLLAHAAERRISDIAFACGFNDLSYFNRCFRRRFGLTPTAARGR
jgi:AraC-like DNA-binding protein